MNLLLIDGTNVVMRHAFAQLGSRQTHPDDLDIERVCGSVEWALWRVAEKVNATHSVICFDSEGETWRKELYPDYKKSRPPGTSAWSKRASEWLSKTGWKCAAVPSFEGDDVVATMTRRAVSVGHMVWVFSGDQDLLQLTDVADVVQFGNKGNGDDKYAVRDVVYLHEKFGVGTAAEFTVWKALVGDSGDEIPGCKGIGPVRAGKLIAKYRANVDDMLGAEIDIDPEQFKLMLQLVSLRTDVPIEPIRPAECRVPARMEMQ